jgi:hypothetical protein
MLTSTPISTVALPTKMLPNKAIATLERSNVRGSENVLSSETVACYFDTLNAGQFANTAKLFATEGVMFPPFEDGVIGPTAIATYLDAEAHSLRLFPETSTCKELPDGQHQVHVKGRVQTLLFSVNVAWAFLLTPQAEIQAVSIQLLASLEELLPYRRP